MRQRPIRAPEVRISWILLEPQRSACERQRDARHGFTRDFDAWWYAFDVDRLSNAARIDADFVISNRQRLEDRGFIRSAPRHPNSSFGIACGHIQQCEVELAYALGHA